MCPQTDNTAKISHQAPHIVYPSCFRPEQIETPTFFHQFTCIGSTTIFTCLYRFYNVVF